MHYHHIDIMLQLLLLSLFAMYASGKGMLQTVKARPSRRGAKMLLLPSPHSYAMFHCL
jgi:hypothetical protein